MDKYNVLNPYDGILLDNIINEVPTHDAIWLELETYAKRKKPVMEDHILCDYMKYHIPWNTHTIPWNIQNKQIQRERDRK